MKADFILLDGAMGTMLQAAGLPLGARPDVFGAEHPDIVESIHRAYLDAGSRILYANTFGSNAHKLAGTGHTPEELICANIASAKRVAGSTARVALDIGPIGELLEPLGTLSFEEAYACYREMCLAGEKAGADLIVIETFTDLQDARAALLAARENTSLPVYVTMSFEKSGRTFTGTLATAAAMVLTGLGADAIGINCSLGPNEILPILREMRAYTHLPFIVKPNAGLPDPATGSYAMTAGEFRDDMRAFLPLGVMAMGGCCGTDPAFIRALSGLLGTEYVPEPRPEPVHGICSAMRVLPYGRVHPVGERLNPTGKKRLQQALRDGDYAFLARTAMEQADAGADVLDINAGLPGIDEKEAVVRTVREVQAVTDTPLMLDSTKPDVLEAGLRAYAGRAIINSVNGSEKSLSTILPLAARYGAAVVGLCMDENGIPQTVEARLAIAERIIARAEALGIARHDLLIDTLTLTVSAQQEQARHTLDALRIARETLGVHAVLGVSNISFGLPERAHVTEAFFAQALYCGLDFPIINPNQKGMMDVLASHRVLSGEDASCQAYIARFAQQTESAPAPQPSTVSQGLTLEDAILRGLRQEAGELAEAALATVTPEALIDTRLIPVLDTVGERYEKGIIFLPQLINAAAAASVAFDRVRARIAASGSGQASRGTILLATVHGDIHDIGKNIVRAVLENYGYRVIDLGRDVPKEQVVEAAIRHDVHLVGLSALMTTTVSSMEETIKALRDSGHPCKIMVGGAVLTADYAARIGADYYCKDAAASAQVAREVLA